MLSYENNGNVMYDVNRDNITSPHIISNNEAIDTCFYNKNT